MHAPRAPRYVATLGWFARREHSHVQYSHSGRAGRAELENVYGQFATDVDVFVRAPGGGGGGGDDGEQLPTARELITSVHGAVLEVGSSDDAGHTRGLV